LTSRQLPCPFQLLNSAPADPEHLASLMGGYPLARRDGIDHRRIAMCCIGFRSLSLCSERSRRTIRSLVKHQSSRPFCKKGFSAVNIQNGSSIRRSRPPSQMNLLKGEGTGTRLKSRGDKWGSPLPVGSSLIHERNMAEVASAHNLHTVAHLGG
jgi:hypothetical protein